VKYLGLDAPDQGTVYWPIPDGVRNRFVLIRSERPSMLAQPLRQRVRELDPNLAVTGVMTVDELVTDSLATPRYLSVLVGTFGAAALALSIVGIYGVMTHFVQRHRRDIGIRLALGGDPARVRRLVIGQGLAVVAIGVAAGVGAAFFTGKIVGSVLFDVSPTDPLTLTMVPCVLVAAAALACALPARRASTISPAEILKES
jgi:ABC-type antimicrobial peptide transport system permease subunit